MQILLVEDTLDIGESIQAYLEASGYRVFRAQNLKAMYEILQIHHIDCVVLDRMLPDGSGAQACREIKAQRTIPILLQTAKGQLDDKVEGFEAGADDYLTKPFDLKELELRIKALTKRQTPSRFFVRKDIEIDLDAQIVSQKGKKIPMSRKEFVLLELLCEYRGRSISRTQLLDEVRGEDALRGKDNKLDVYISGLRKKLGKKFIETIKGFGYKVGV